jgi:hypothetical protein
MPPPFPFWDMVKEEAYHRDWHIRPPPHIRPVLLLDLVAKGCTSYKTHKFKGVLHVKIDD